MNPSKQFKTFLAILLALLTVATLCTSLLSCDDSGASSSESTDPEKDTSNILNSTDTSPIIGNDSEYLELDLDEYIKLSSYTGLTITVTDKNADRGELIWNAIVEGAEVLKYPEDKVRYYFEQTRQKYMDYAGNDTDQYEYVLNHYKITEAIMMEDARRLVKEDLVYYYMVKKSEIVLTDEEKQELFDKYVDYYVDNYKYSKDYVIANMSSLIYDSMLYDKTMEYLMLNNTFVDATDTSTTTVGTESDTESE